MVENTSNIKKHTCPTCGGQLIVNEVRKMYECPFCGVTFDYEYFREDDVLERASRAIRLGEFQSAKEAYEFMLAKEPSNFEALRGMILVYAGARSTAEFADPKKLKTKNTPSVDEKIQYAIEHCLPEHQSYFSKMKELFDAADVYEEGLNKNKDLRSDQKLAYSDIQRIEDKKGELFFHVNDPQDPAADMIKIHPRSIAGTLIGLYVFYAIFVLLIFGAMKNPYTKATSEKTRSTKATTKVNYTLPDYFNNYMVEKELKEMYEKRGMDPAEASKKAAADAKNAQKNMQKYVAIDYNSFSNKMADKSESQRLEKEEKWNKDHANMDRNRMLFLLIPAGVLVLACIYLFHREYRIKKFETETMKPYRNRASEITNEILKNEESTNRMKTNLTHLYQEMKKLDPVPEKVSMPVTIKEKKQSRKRWE